MARVLLRCPDCLRFTPAFWLNLYSLALWVVIVAANYLNLWAIAPITTLAAQLRVDVHLSLRIYLALTQSVGPWVLLLVLVWFLVLPLSRRRLPQLLKGGKALAVLTLLGVVWSLAGLLASIFAHWVFLARLAG